MAQTFLIFDFGTNEEAAQQARHKIEGWKQGFRLGDKMQVKFQREDTSSASQNGSADDRVEENKPSKKSTGGAKAASAKKKSDAIGRVRLFLRLGFSDHEKISQQRWLDRIPNEEPFKSAKGETVRHGDPEFEASAELFEGLD